MEKRCRRCGQIKSIEEFHKRANARDKHMSWCKSCSKAHDLAYRQAHPKEVAAYQCAYAKAHRKEIAEHRRANRLAYPEIAEKDRAYKLAHIKEAIEQRHTYQLTHAGEIAKQARAYRLAHPEIYAKQARIFRLTYPEKVARCLRAWQLANPDRKADIEAHRRARKLAAFIEPVSRLQVYARDGGRCHVCGKKVDPKHWQIDHLVPLSLGGEHSYRNVAVACPKCNQRRYNTGPAQLRLFG